MKGQNLKAHTVYRNDENEIVPGVTTVLSVLNKPALVSWANRLGLAGIDSSKYTDKSAAIGTLAHMMIEKHLAGEIADLSEYSPSDVGYAENALIKYWDWEKEHTIGCIFSERELHCKHYGGTIDFYGMIDDKKTLVDFKTCKALYPEHFYQLAAYKHLLIVNGFEVEETRILRIGRDESEGFEERKGDNLTKQYQIFRHCLAIYNLTKQLKGGNNG